MNFLEFWKTQCFFGILKNSKNNLVFFGIWSKNLKKTNVFLEFHNKFQIINSKKTLGFSRFSTKIPKKHRVFLEFFTIPKKPWVFQNSKILKDYAYLS